MPYHLRGPRALVLALVLVLAVGGTAIAFGGGATGVKTERAVNCPPQARDDAARAEGIDPITVDVLDNDTDPDGDLLLFNVVQSSGGSVKVDQNGTPTDSSDDRLSYTPLGTSAGVETVTYEVEDPGGLTDQATVTIVIGGDDAGPAAAGETDGGANAEVLDADDSVDEEPEPRGPELRSSTVDPRCRPEKSSTTTSSTTTTTTTALPTDDTVLDEAAEDDGGSFTFSRAGTRRTTATTAKRRAPSSGSTPTGGGGSGGSTNTTTVSGGNATTTTTTGGSSGTTTTRPPSTTPPPCRTAQECREAACKSNPSACQDDDDPPPPTSTTAADEQ